MNDTTSEASASAFDESTDQAAEFMEPAIRAAREAGVPEQFDDNTAVFMHRTAASGGYTLVAFDPNVLVRWAKAKGGFRLLEASIAFLPYGMPVLSVGLEDVDATEGGPESENDKQ